MSELECLRECGNIHKQLKLDIKNFIKPGQKILDIVNFIEDEIQKRTNTKNKSRVLGGVAFPTGFSINNCAAHWTPESYETDILKKDDIIKIDFGIHKNGYIIDSAYTHAFDDKYNPLIESTIEANKIAIKNSGVDACLSEIGRSIKEVIESYEIEINNELIRLKPVIDLTGHSISRYKIHSGKGVPNTYLYYYKERMKDGEIYAIEPFASTGCGRVFKDESFCSHYMINNFNLNDKRLNKEDKNLLKTIYKNNMTLPFCTRWLNNNKIKFKRRNLNNLVNCGIVESYPPLYDSKNSFVSQHEHTISITENGVEILS